MTLIQPNTLWDVGFQLSFAATLGLVLYAGPWSRRLGRGTSQFLTPDANRRVGRILSEVVVVTLAAQVLTLPLLLYHFGRLSLVSLPANFLVLPVQPAVMVAGGVTMLLGMIAPPLGRVPGLVAWLFLDYTIDAIEMLARMPRASVPLSLSGGGLVGVYGVIGLVTLTVIATRNRPRAESKTRVSFVRLVPAVAILAIVVFLFAAWLSDRPDGRLHVAFLDVGQGDAILIRTPNDRQLLVDGGRYPATTLDQLGEQMPFWDRSIDLVIATHPDADHVTGLVDVVERYDVSRLITNGADPGSDSAYAALLAAAQARETPIHLAQIGEVIILDEGVRLEILHTMTAQTADSRNDSSIVARLTYGDLSMLLTGDAEGAAESALLATDRPLAAVVLKAGHHGANTSSSEPFLRAVAPRFIIISAGRDNEYGHPHPAMLARAEALGAVVLRTDEMGTVELATDGEKIWWAADRIEAAGAELSP
jgi:competence protein ComEC